jgi:methylaspartate mutase epsilon subunit
MLARDAENAVRYVDFGDIPMPKEVKEFHRQKLAEREEKLGKKIGLDIVAQDLQFASVLKYK